MKREAQKWGFSGDFCTSSFKFLNSLMSSLSQQIRTNLIIISSTLEDIIVCFSKMDCQTIFFSFQNTIFTRNNDSTFLIKFVILVYFSNFNNYQINSVFWQD